MGPPVPWRCQGVGTGWGGVGDDQAPLPPPSGILQVPESKPCGPSTSPSPAGNWYQQGLLGQQMGRILVVLPPSPVPQGSGDSVGMARLACGSHPHSVTAEHLGGLAFP